MINNGYKAALEWAKEYFCCIDDTESGFTLREKMYGFTIIKALKIANKLVQEPSKDMLTRGNIPSSTAYRAMVEQLLSEVE